MSWLQFLCYKFSVDCSSNGVWGIIVEPLFCNVIQHCNHLTEADGAGCFYMFVLAIVFLFVFCVVSSQSVRWSVVSLCRSPVVLIFFQKDSFYQLIQRSKQLSLCRLEL